MARFDEDALARLITISNEVDELRAALDALLGESVPGSDELRAELEGAGAP